MIKQKTSLEVILEGKNYQLICDSDSPLGCLHDALMQMKGWTVERMIKAQREEEAHANQKIEPINIPDRFGYPEETK